MKMLLEEYGPFCICLSVLTLAGKDCLMNVFLLQLVRFEKSLECGLGDPHNLQGN